MFLKYHQNKLHVHILVIYLYTCISTNWIYIDDLLEFIYIHNWHSEIVPANQHRMRTCLEIRLKVTFTCDVF